MNDVVVPMELKIQRRVDAMRVWGGIDLAAAKEMNIRVAMIKAV